MRAALNPVVYLTYAALMVGFHIGSKRLDQPWEPVGEVLYAVAGGSCILAAIAAHRHLLWWLLSAITVPLGSAWRLFTIFVIGPLGWEFSDTPPDDPLMACLAYTTIIISVPFVWIFLRNNGAWLDCDNDDVYPCPRGRKV